MSLNPQQIQMLKGRVRQIMQLIYTLKHPQQVVTGPFVKLGRVIDRSANLQGFPEESSHVGWERACLCLSISN